MRENCAQLSHDVCTTQQWIAKDDQRNIPYIFFVMRLALVT